MFRHSKYIEVKAICMSAILYEVDIDKAFSDEKDSYLYYLIFFGYLVANIRVIVMC